MVVPTGAGNIAFRAFDQTYLEVNPNTQGSYTVLEGIARYHSRGEKMHAIAQLEGQDAEPKLSLQVRRGPVWTGTFVDTSGQPIAGGAYSGYDAHFGWRPFSAGTFAMVNHDPNVPRRITVASDDLSLSASMVISDQPSHTVSIMLKPSATLTGRIVDAGGNPVSGLGISPGRIRTQASPNKDKNQSREEIPVPQNDGSNQVVTDDDGRFTIRGLVAGQAYDLSGFGNRIFGEVIRDAVMKEGETRDLGNFQLRKP